LSGISTLTGQEISDDGLGGGLSRVGLPVRAGAAARLPVAAHFQPQHSPSCCDCSRSVFTGSIVQAYGDGVKDRPRSIQRTAVYGPVCTVVAPRVVLATDRGKRIPGRSARTARSTSQLSTPARSSPLPSSVGYTTATRGYSFWEGQVRARGQAFGVIGPSRSLMKTCADCPCSR
jgi:hypothetical protein